MIHTVLLCRDNQSLNQLHGLAMASGLQVLGTATTLGAAQRLLCEHKAGLLITEPDAANGPVLGLVRSLRTHGQPLAVKVLLKLHQDQGEAVWDLMCAGADSYWLPQATMTLREAVQSLHRGGAAMSAWMARRVLEELPPVPHNAPWSTVLDELRNPLRLSNPEMNLVLLLAQGMSLTEVSQTRCVREQLLAECLQGVYRKLRWSRAGETLSLAA